MHGEVDGRKVAFTGDNIFGDPDDPTQTGHEAMVAHNSAILEEGYIYGAEYLSRLKPDILIGGHSFVMDHPGAFIERYRKWSYEMRDAFKSLSSESNYRYWFDPFWVRAEPYRVEVARGASAEVSLKMRNFLHKPQKYRIVIASPDGVTVKPEVIEQNIPAESVVQIPLHLTGVPGAELGVHLAGLDITVNGKRYGQFFDFVINTTAEKEIGK